MDNFGSVLRALQYGDSFFPSGSVSFSWGLEALVESRLLTRPKDVQDFVIGQLQARWACFERTIVASAHRAAKDLGAVGEIDHLVERMSPAAELRHSSRRMGDAMLSVFQRLGYDAAVQYREHLRTNLAPGHIAVMQGLLWSEAGLGETAAVALSAHTFCTGLVSAGVRLGCLTHITAQKLLEGARAAAEEIIEQPMTPLDELSTYGIEAEIAVMRHASQEQRLFAN